MLSQLCQICRRGLAPAVPGEGRGASVEIQAAALARAARTLARAAYPVHLRDQSGDALSLRKTRTRLGPGR